METVTAINNDGATPVATAAGDPCEIMGTVQENQLGTYYWTPASSGELVWSSEANIAAHQEAEAEVEDYKQQLHDQKETTAKAEEKHPQLGLKLNARANHRRSQPGNTQAPAPAPAHEQSDTGRNTRFANCTEARSAGAAHAHRGDADLAHTSTVTVLATNRYYSVRPQALM